MLFLTKNKHNSKYLAHISILKINQLYCKCNHDRIIYIAIQKRKGVGN